MYGLLQVVTVMLVAVCAALSGAHALELPGKMRLDEPTYRAVQRIYYPGFTIGGAAEPLAVVATGLLLFLTPAGTMAFWLVLLAFLAMLAMMAIYWLAVHPVNKHWMEGQAVSASAAAFFGKGTSAGRQPGFEELRSRWEYAHVARAVLTGAGLLSLVISAVIEPQGAQAG